MGIINDFFGMILNLIFEGVALVVPVGTLGVSIIMFTLVTRLLLTPLQIKQQRTTRAMSKIQPEMKRIQKKYANKKDQASQMAYSQEMQGVYKKYKISPLSGCLPLLIQLPLIYALYNVLRQPSRHIVALGDLYVKISEVITNMVPNFKEVIAKVVEQMPLSSTAMYELQKLGESAPLSDQLSHFTTQQWELLLANIPQNAQLSELLIQKQNIELFIVNLVDSPQQLVSSGMWLALLVPVAAGASTFIFSKITMASSRAMQQGTTDSGEANPADSMMKVMNIMMPIMMGVFSYSVPCGLALYWIAGNIIMMLQQIWVNKIVDKQDKKLEEQLRQEREAQGIKKKKRPRPEGEKTSKPKGEGTDSQGQKPRKPRPEGQSVEGQKPRRPRPEGQAAKGQKPRKPRPEGQAAEGQKPRKTRPEAEVTVNKQANQSDNNQSTSESKNLKED